MTITSALSTVVSDVPYLKNKQDEAAVIAGIDKVRKALANVKDLKWLSPAPGVSTKDYVTNVSSHYHSARLFLILTVF